MSYPDVEFTSGAGKAAQVRAAIASASRQSGVDFGYLLAQAKVESRLDPDATASGSSATGLFQFIDSTWLSTFQKHGAALGFGDMAGTASRAEILALRRDPEVSALLAGALASDNRAALIPVLGREPDASELYLAHFLGAAGAERFFRKLAANPATLAANILPQAASSNRPIFYTEAGEPRSVSGVMGVIRGKMQAAMSGERAPVSSEAPLAPVRSPRLPTLPAPQVASMAETLLSSFGGLLPHGQGHVRTAYARLEAFRL